MAVEIQGYRYNGRAPGPEVLTGYLLTESAKAIVVEE